MLKGIPSKTIVGVLLAEGHEPYLYEVGQPIGLSDLPWSVNVGQRIPLGFARNRLFRRELATAVLNEMHGYLRPDEASCPLLQHVLPMVSAEAVRSVLFSQHGHKIAIASQIDGQANSLAAAHGYAVLMPGAYSGLQWDAIRKAGAAIPADELFPTPILYSTEGVPARTVPAEQWTEGMHRVAEYSQELARRLLNREVIVVMENEASQNYVANYGPGCLVFNVPRLTPAWFDLKHNFVEINDLLIHEFGHETSLNHLSDEYHLALTRLGSELAHMMLTEPETFHWYTR